MQRVVCPESYRAWLRAKENRAFTLVELLVVLGLMSLFSTLFVGGYMSFRDELAMSRYAQGIASAFRKAESGSIVAAAESYTSPEAFPGGYGIYTDLDTMPRKFYFFKDIDPDGAGPQQPNGRYDAGERIRAISLPNQITIIKTFLYDASSSEVAKKPLSLLFHRPDPTLIAYKDTTLLAASHYGIRIQSSSGSARTIHVWSTGQIYVSKP